MGHLAMPSDAEAQGHTDPIASLERLAYADELFAASEAKDARIAELEREVAQMAPIIVAAERWRDSDYLPTGLAGIQIAVDDRRAARTRLLDPPSPCEQSPQPATAQEQPQDHEDDRSAPRR